MDYAILGLLITGITSLLLGGFVFLKNTRSLPNFVFALLNLAVAGWSYFLMIQLAFDIVFYNKIANASAIFISIFWLHLVLLFLNKAFKKRAVLFLGYIVAFVMAFITITTDLVVAGLKPVLFFTSYIDAGPFFLVHLIIFASMAIFGIVELTLAFKNSTGNQRKRLKYLLLAGLAGFTIGSTTYLPGWDIKIIPLGLYLTWLYTPIIGYSIFKFRMFDITVLIRKSIIFSLLVLLVTSFYHIAVMISQELLLSRFGFNDWTMAFVVSLVIALSFTPIKNLLASITDSVFFKKRYDYQKTIHQVSRAISSLIKLDELCLLLDKTLKESIKVKSSNLFLLNKIENRYEEKTLGKRKPKIIEQKSPLHQYLSDTRRLLVTEDLERKADYPKISIQSLSILAKVEDQLKKDNWALSLPLIVKDEIIGILNLEPKLSGDAFSSTDLQLLSTLSSQVAVAVENSSVYEEERKLSKAKSEFVSVASHRLRTPLSVVKWALNLLNEESEKLLPRQRELVEKAMTSNEGMIKLANDLLKVSRIEEKKFTSLITSVQLQDIVEGIIAEYKEPIEKKGLIIDLDKPEDTLPRIKADENRIKIALINIFDNAITYTPKNGSVFVTLKYERARQTILLSIRDTGIGIPRYHHDQIFTKFYREENAISVYTEGSGLGLFTTKNIIEEHNGEIWFESAEDQGATFWIRFPIEKINK